MIQLSRRKYHLILVILICLQVMFFVYWGNQKEGYHIDEIYSYGLSNSYYESFMEKKSDFFYSWNDSEFFNDYLEVQENERFQYDSVYYNQTQDVSPPLYYFLLHTVCSIFHMTGGYRGSQVIHNLSSSNIIEQFREFIVPINLEIFNGIIKWYLLSFVLSSLYFFLYKNMSVSNRDNNKMIQVSFHKEFVCDEKFMKWMSLFVVLCGYYVLVAIITTIIADRYMFPIYPIIIIFIVKSIELFIENINKCKRIILVFSVGLICYLNIYTYNFSNLEYLYCGYLEKQEILETYQSQVFYCY